MRLLGDANYFQPEGTQIAHLKREKQSGSVQQYNGSVQTFGVLKRTSGHKRHYHPQSNTRRE